MGEGSIKKASEPRLSGSETAQKNRGAKNNNDAYRVLFEKSKDAIVILKNEQFVDCNQAALDMLGYHDKHRLLKTHPSKLSPDFQSDGRDSYTKAREMMDIALKNGSHRFEWEHIRANGTIFPVEVLFNRHFQSGRQPGHSYDLERYHRAGADGKSPAGRKRNAFNHS